MAKQKPLVPKVETQVSSWWTFFGIYGKTSDSKAPSTKPLTVWDHRANAVRDAFLFSFRSYTRRAGGYDELLPVSGGKVNK